MTSSEIRAVVLETLKAVGLADRVISQREAERTYGRWFRDAVSRGELKPCRTGARVRWYSVAEILEYEQEGREQARLIMDTLKHNAI